MNAIEQKTFDLASPIAMKIGLTIEEVEFVKEHGNQILRVLVDKEEGVNVLECTKLSEELSLELDKEDFITMEYMLEVSSLGAERELKSDKDILKAIDQYVHIKLYQKQNDLKEFEGYLKSYDGEIVTIEIMVGTRKKEVSINKKDISKIRLAIKF